MPAHNVLVNITGLDRPGVTSALFAVLAAHDVQIVDVEQVVIRDRLVLGILLKLHGEPGSLHQALLRTADAMDLDIDILVGDEIGEHEHKTSRHHVLLLGNPLRAGAVGEVARHIADQGGNIDSIVRLSDYPVTSLELMVSGAESAKLREALALAAKETGTDIAVERAGLHRRAKRLLVLDVDSTLVQGEIIDVLAEHAGCGEKVAEITAAAMAGELDFVESLQARVKLLAGLPLSTVEEAGKQLKLARGARTLIRTAKRMGYRCGVVSGGFTHSIDPLVKELKLDFGAANTLEVHNGRLTGQLVGEIVDRAGKAKALARFAEQFEIPLSQTVAVGDGANDIDMLNTAGLGIAFNAKPAVREVADAALNYPYLDAILFFLGISRRDIEQADAED